MPGTPVGRDAVERGSARSSSAYRMPVRCAGPATSARASPTRRSNGCVRSSRRSNAPTHRLRDVPKMPRVRRSDVVWVDPTLVAEVEFAEWTHEGRLRAPSYLRLREDTTAPDVRRERVTLPPVIKRRGRELRFSNVDKPFWPEEGITKGDLIAYYRDVAEVLVPHLRGRPFTMKRYPDGWQGKNFFQKNAPSHMPEWIERAPFPASTREGERRIVEYAVVNDELALLWMANMALHRPAHLGVTRGSSRAPRLGDVRPRPVGGRRLRRRDRGGVAGQADARSPRARELPEDLWLTRDPRARARRAAALVRGGYESSRASSPARSRVRIRASRRPSGRRRSDAECSSMRTRTGRGGRTLRSTRCGRGQELPCRRRFAGRRSRQASIPRGFTMDAVLDRVARYGDLLSGALGGKQSLKAALKSLR